MEHNAVTDAQDLLAEQPDGPPESPDYLEIATSAVNTQPKNDTGMTNFRSLQAAIAMSKREAGEPGIPEIADRFVQYKGMAENDPGYASLKKMVLDARANDDTEGMKALLEHYINTLTPERAKDMAVGMGGIFREIQESKRDPANYHDAVLDTIAPTLDEATHNEMVVQQKLAEMTYDVMQQNEGAWAKIKNYGGLLLKGFVYPILHDDISDFTGSSMLRPGESTKWFEAWNSLSADEKLQRLPEIKQRAMEAANGNPVRAAYILQKMTMPYSEQTITSEAVLETGLASTGLLTPKLITGMVKSAKQAINPLGYLKQAAKDADAAKLNATIVQDGTEKLADTTGVPRDVAATNALPWRTSHLDPSMYTEGIHGKTMQELRKIEQDLAELMKPGNPIMADPLRAAEIVAAKEKYLTKWRTFADEPGSGFNQLVLKSVGDTGLEAEITFGSKTTGEALRTKKGAEARLQELKDMGIITSGEVVEKSPGRFLIQSKDKHAFTIEDVGAMEGAASVGPVQAYLATPSLVIAKLEGRTVTSEAVNATTRAELGGAKLANTLTAALETALRPIGKSFITPKARASLKRLDEVLLQGDAHTEIDAAGEVTRGKVYTIDELQAGIPIPTKGGGTKVVSLNDDEISAYFATRRILDYMFMLKNDQVHKTLTFRGFRRVDVEGVDAIGKPIDTAAGARLFLQGKGVEKMYNPLGKNGKGSVMNKSDIDFEELYNNGFKMIKLDEAVSIAGTHYDYVFVNAKNITDLPSVVLKRKIGYVPKIYKDAFYFVKENMRGSLNGVDDSMIGSKTLRMFDSKKEADAYLAKQAKTRFLIREQLNATNDKDAAGFMEELRNMGHSDDEIREMMEEHLRGRLSANFDKNNKLEDVYVVADREMSADQLLRESYGMHGGLFTGRRATHDILFGVSGEVPKRFSAYESIQRYIQHVSNYYPRNQWRMAEQQRWMNTARAMNAIRPEITQYKEAIQSVTLKAGSKEKASLDAYATWINDQARIPTNEEVWLSQHMRSLVEWAETPLTVFGETIASAKAPKIVRNSIMNLAQKDPFSAMRAAAFHPLIGWFNPSQLFVQAQGASVAFALHPTTALRDIRRSFGLTSMMWVDNPKALAVTAKSLGLKPEEFTRMRELFIKAGLRDSVKATADHSAAAQSYGITLKAVKDVADKGLMFYRPGEFFNRTYSFSAATEKWLEANKGKTIMDIGDKELKSIIDDSMHMSLNMLRANRAQWQKGAAGVPTQFWQIQAKLIESVLPTMLGGNKKFTPAQKSRLLLSQFALYGAAGVPLGNYLVNYAAQQAGVTPEQLSPETKKYLNGGMWDVMAYSMLGADVELGGRAAIMNNLVENMIGIATATKPISGMFGAFGSVSGNVFNGLATLKPLVANADKINWSAKEIALVGNELAKTASSWNNMTKAHAMLMSNQIFDRKGNVVYDAGPSGFSAGTIIGQALGFRASPAKYVNDLKMVNKITESVIKDYTQSVIDIQHRYLGGLTAGLNTKESEENAQVMMDYLRATVNDEVVWNRIMDSARQRILSGEDEKTKQIMQYYRTYSSSIMDKSTSSWIGFGGPNTNPLLGEEQTKMDEGK